MQGVSYTVSNITLPSLLRLPSSSSASHAIASINESLQTPLLTLSSLAAVPFFLSFVGSPRSLRHPYLLYTSLLAVLSTAVPRFLPQPAARPAAAKKPAVPRPRMDASYEVLGDVQSETASEEELVDDVNGEEVRAEVQSLSRSFATRGGFAAIGFVMAVVGIWGDGAPRATVVVA